MTYTYSDLQTYLDGYFDDAGTQRDTQRWSSALKQLVINESYKKMMTIIMDYTEYWIKKITKTTSSGVQKYDMPDDCLYIRRVWIEDSHELEFQEHRDPRADVSTYDEPTRYFVDGCYEIINGSTNFVQIGFYPIPDDSYSVLIEYFPIPQDMSDNTEINRLPASFNDLILLGAAKELADVYGIAELSRMYADELRNRLPVFIQQVGRRHRHPSPRRNIE